MKKNIIFDIDTPVGKINVVAAVNMTPPLIVPTIREANERVTIVRSVPLHDINLDNLFDPPASAPATTPRRLSYGDTARWLALQLALAGKD
jgi:hypothetical protein